MVNERLENGVKMIRLNMWAVETNMNIESIKRQWGSEFHYHCGSSLKMLNSPTSEETLTVVAKKIE